MGFRRIQLIVGNNYNPQKNIFTSFFVINITKFDIKLILLRFNSLISQWNVSTVWTTYSLAFMVIILTQSKAQVKQFALKKFTFMECQGVTTS